MKRYSKAVPVFLLLVFGAMASGPAMAQRYGHGYGYGHGGGVRFGISLGIPLYALGYYSNPYYSYPAYAYPGPDYGYPGPAMAPSGAYAEQGYAQAAPAPAQQQDWYFCAGSNAYYPYVRECPSGWQRVPAQPPR